METKTIKVSLSNYERLIDIGEKNESFNDIILKLINEYEEYQKIQGIIEARNQLKKMFK